jgi:hypothetical protein
MGEFERVAKQVCEHLLQAAGVAAAEIGRGRIDSKREADVGLLGGQLDEGHDGLNGRD